MTSSRIATLLGLPRRVLALLARGDSSLGEIERLARRSLKLGEDAAKQDRHMREVVAAMGSDLRRTNKEVVALRHELRKRLLQYHHQLGRMARVVGTAASSDVLLSGRSVPTEAADEEPLPWSSIGQSAEVPDTEGAEWVQLSECPVCGAVDRIRISPWNKLILTTKAPGQTSAQYDYSMCHACGVLFAERRPRSAAVTGSSWRISGR